MMSGNSGGPFFGCWNSSLWSCHLKVSLLLICAQRYNCADFDDDSLTNLEDKVAPIFYSRFRFRARVLAGYSVIVGIATTVAFFSAAFVACPTLKVYECTLPLVRFPNPLVPGRDIQVHVSWGTWLIAPHSRCFWQFFLFFEPHYCPTLRVKGNGTILLRNETQSPGDWTW